jgi:benzoyl-CoA 2,3-dioxygenase component B
MLKEEAFHLFTGQSGLTRIVKAGKVPTQIIQKYFNKWISTAYDLFGKDRSTSVLRFYRWGLKGRFNEAKGLPPPQDLERLNEEARSLYVDEVREIVNGLNRPVPEGEAPLYVPNVKFNRKIGDYAGKTFAADGRLLTPDEYRRHLEEVLPGPNDERFLRDVFKDGNGTAI